MLFVVGLILIIEENSQTQHEDILNYCDGFDLFQNSFYIYTTLLVQKVSSSNEIHFN